MSRARRVDKRDPDGDRALESLPSRGSGRSCMLDVQFDELADRADDVGLLVEGQLGIDRQCDCFACGCFGAGEITALVTQAR